MTTKKAAPARPRSRQTTTADTTFYAITDGCEQILLTEDTRAKSYDALLSGLKDEAVRDQWCVSDSEEVVEVEVFEVIRRAKLKITTNINVKIVECK